MITIEFWNVAVYIALVGAPIGINVCILFYVKKRFNGRLDKLLLKPRPISNRNIEALTVELSELISKNRVTFEKQDALAAEMREELKVFAENSDNLTIDMTKQIANLVTYLQLSNATLNSVLEALKECALQRRDKCRL